MGTRLTTQNGASIYDSSTGRTYYATFYVNDDSVSGNTYKAFYVAMAIGCDTSGATTSSWVTCGPFTLTVTVNKGSFRSGSPTSITYASSREDLNLKIYKGITFYINPNSSGQIQFTINMTCSGLYNTGSAGNSSKSWTSNTFTTVSACTAPTSLSVTPNSIISGSSSKSFTLSWSGAKGGTGNPIKNYTAYCRIGSAPGEPEAQWHFIQKEITTTSCSFTIPLTSTTTKGGYYLDISHNRGSTIYFGVIAVSTVAGYNAPMKTVAGSKINSLPSAPTINANPTTADTRSYTTSITFSTPSDPDTSQTRTVYYSTSTSGTRTSITTGRTITVTAPSDSENIRTLYFWTWDGLEYSSSYTTKNFGFGVNPDTPTVIGTPVAYSVYNTSGTATTYYSKLTNVQAIGINTSGTITPYLEYKTTSASSYSQKQLSAVTSSGTGSISLPDIDVDALLYGINSSYRTQNMNWRVYCTFKASGVTKTTERTNAFTIGATPSTIRAQYNRIDADSNYAYTTAGHMSKTARILVPKDGTLTLTKSNITCKINNSTISASDFTATISDQTSYYRVDITLNNYPPSAAAIVFSLKFTSSGGNSRTYTVNYTGTKRPTDNSFGALTLVSGNPVQAFDNGNLQFSLSKQLSTATGLSDLLTEYECNTATTGNHLGFYVYNKNKTNYKSFNVSGATISDDKIIGSIPYTSLFDFGNEILTILGITPTTGYHGNYGTDCAFVMEKGYGDTLSTTVPTSYNINYNFDKDPTDIAIGDIQYSIDGGTTYSSLGNTPLRVGMRLKFPISFKLYTYEDVVIRLKLAQGSNDAQFILNTESIPAGSANYASGRGAPASTSVNIYYDIGTAITSPGNWGWTPVVSVTRSNTRKDVSGTGKIVAATQQKPPATIVLNDCSLTNETNNTVTFDFHYTISDSGLPSGKGSYVLKMVINQTYAPQLSQSTLGTNISGSITVPKGSVSDVNMMQIRLTSTVDDVTMDYDSIAIFVYRQAPLISYRKNVIGINTSKPEEQNGGTAVVVVQSANGKQEVVMLGDRQSGDSSESVMLLIDIPEGKIEFKKRNGSTYDTTHKYIDFINGEIHGFVLK